ncbi:MAG: zinc-binding dehydrogenase [Planctomycetia bacterium]|nr:zinc-binding dehydrogenase [Planctomycetia bacterium]
MKGYVVYKDGTRRIEELPMPTYGKYDALVKIESCGVCNGTDMKIIHGKFKGVDQYPVVLGHEGVGRVVEIGAKVRNFKIGDLVLMPFLGEPPQGYYSAWGTYAEFNIVSDADALEADGKIPHEFMFGQRKLPADFDPVASAMIITFREVLSTMRIFGMEPNRSLVVLGLGPVGLSFVKFAKLIGMTPIIALDVQEDKLRLAEKMGADVAINAKNQDVAQAVRAICPDGVDFALDAVGVPSFINTGLDIIKPGAKICVYGISETQNAEVDWSRCPYNWTLQFNQFPSKKMEGEAHGQIVSWIQMGILDPSEFVSHVIDFPNMDEAFQKIERREPMLKMVVRFS